MEKVYSVIFAGTPDLAVPSLQALIDDPAFDVKMVITQPDRPVGRKKILQASPVKVLGEKNGVEVWQPSNINTEWDLQATTYNLQPDYLVVVAYGQILKQHILDAPNISAVNLHPSLLPRWRGPSPMKSAILAGDTETGVTIQRMVAKLDAGPILHQVATPLEDHETIADVEDRLLKLGAEVLVQTLKEPLIETEQDESKVTMCHKMTRSIGDIAPEEMSAKDVDAHVRALVPWPGVRMKLDGQDVKILSVSTSETGDSIPLVCKDGTIYITSLQPPGKKAMTGMDWQRGRQ